MLPFQLSISSSGVFFALQHSSQQVARMFSRWLVCLAVFYVALSSSSHIIHVQVKVWYYIYSGKKKWKQSFHLCLFKQDVIAHVFFAALLFLFLCVSTFCLLMLLDVDECLHISTDATTIGTRNWIFTVVVFVLLTALNYGVLIDLGKRWFL